MITIEEIKNNEQIKMYIARADETLAALGYTEHSFAHVTKVSLDAKNILLALGYSEAEASLAEIAGYLHDIGNLINRVDHAQSGAVMAFRILDQLGMDAMDIATIISAIGNHDESTGVAIHPVAAALILADKCDVRRSRVRNRDIVNFDIHDRVNYAVKKAYTKISKDNKLFILNLSIDTKISAVMDYFEIFLVRMMLCRKAAEKLNIRFQLVINEQIVL